MEENEPQQPDEQAMPSLTRATLRDRYRVLLDQPYPIMDRGEGKAYLAADLRNSSLRLYALVADPAMPIRDKLAQSLSNKPTAGLIELHDHGIVSMDGLENFRYVFFFDRPNEGRAFQESQGALSEQDVLGKIVPRIIDMLIDFDSRNLTHRGIRADNLYYMDEEKVELVLGECVSMPPAANQPAVYEPVESANALSFGRGEIEPAADIYALGVLIVHLLGGVEPAKGMSAANIYSSKLEHGSYATLVPKINASSRVGFLLAGLLNDDPARRWKTEVLKRWRDGVYERPRPGFGDRQAPGPFLFSEKEYVSPRRLAQALTAQPSKAFLHLEDGKLESWVRNSLNSPEEAGKIHNIVFQGGGGRGARRTESQAVSRVSSILDNEGSLWYRDLKFSRGGLGSLLAFSFMPGQGNLKNTAAEFLSSGLLGEVVAQDAEKGEKQINSWMPLGSASEAMEFLSRQDQLGFGLERCLYELNPTLSCISSTLEGSYVNDTRTLMTVLEAKALKAKGKINPFDRHISAFAAAKARSTIKTVTRMAMMRTESVEYAMTLLGLFGRMQVLFHPGPLPGLCDWMETILKPLIKKMHSEMRREQIMARYESVKKDGNIDQILVALDLINNLERDAKEYDHAINEFVNINHSLAALENGVPARKAAAGRFGHWLASVLSITCLVGSMGFSFLYFIGH